jgi:hypothetical protein
LVVSFRFGALPKAGQNPKSEIRGPKEARRPKSEPISPAVRAIRTSFGPQLKLDFRGFAFNDRAELELCAPASPERNKSTIDKDSLGGHAPEERKIRGQLLLTL